jgi:hypothetical protein
LDTSIIWDTRREWRRWGGNYGETKSVCRLDKGLGHGGEHAEVQRG